jgi:hypothetical protein
LHSEHLRDYCFTKLLPKRYTFESVDYFGALLVAAVVVYGAQAFPTLLVVVVLAVCVHQ